MADADIKIDGATVIVDGNWLLVKCWDLKLDSEDRRSGQGGERRALVHGFNDELVVNYADDYPGGVTIRGEIHIPGKIKGNQVRLEAHDLLLDHPDRRSAIGGQRRALVHGFNDELVINWAGDYPSGTVVQGNFEVLSPGILRMKDHDNNTIIELNQLGNILLGGHGQDGNVLLKDQSGNTLIQIEAEPQSFEFKDSDGSVRVKIDSESFTESSWPAWPGEDIPGTLVLIKELRRMKEEIVSLIDLDAHRLDNVDIQRMKDEIVMLRARLNILLPDE